MALLRYAVGVCCLLPPVMLSLPVRFLPRDLVPIALLGIAQFGILVALLNCALRSVPSARAALLFSGMPLLTLLLAAALGRERLAPGKALGVLLTIAGVGLALGEKVAQPGRLPQPWIGEAAVLASALCGAVCSILYRPYLRKYPVLPVSAVAMFASVIFLAVLAAQEGFFRAWPRFTPAGWMAVLFIGVGSGIGYYLWLWALSHATPTQVTASLALSPITAAVLGATLLGEPISASVLLGLVCVGVGLRMAYREESTLAPAAAGGTGAAVKG